MAATARPSPTSSPISRCPPRTATTSNSDIVRRLYDLWSAGLLDDARQLLHPEIHWIEPPEVPDRKIVTGPDAALATVGAWTSAWEEYEVALVETIEAGDRVLAILSQRARGPGSGVDVEGAFYMVWTFRDGMAVRMEMYMDRASAEAAARVEVAT